MARSHFNTKQMVVIQHESGNADEILFSIESKYKILEQGEMQGSRKQTVQIHSEVNLRKALKRNVMHVKISNIIHLNFTGHQLYGVPLCSTGITTSGAFLTQVPKCPWLSALAAATYTAAPSATHPAIF